VISGESIFGSFDATKFMSYNFVQRQHIWWTAVDGEATTPPLKIENTIFFSTRSGKIYSVNATTGAKNWELMLDAHSERPIVFSDGQLYIMTVGQVAYSLDAASGKRLWVYDAGFPEHLIVRRPPAPVIFEGKVIFAVSSGELVSLKADDGKLVWRYNPLYMDNRFHDPVGDMVLLNGKLLITRYDGLVAQIEMGADKKVIWQDKTTSVSTSTFRSGRYYAALVSGEVIAYDATNGRSIWRVNTGATATYLQVGENAVYAIANDGRMFALDMTNGQILWIEDLGSRIAAPPILTENKMYISTGLRNVYGYKL
jgi:outer membrane protein assembly factor BamB